MSPTFGTNCAAAKTYKNRKRQKPKQRRFIRVWDVKDERKLFKRILAHLQENVRFQVFEMMDLFGEEVSGLDFTSLLESTVLVWKKVKIYETRVHPSNHVRLF